MALTLNTAIQSFHKKLRLLMIYHQTTFASKTINSSEDSKVQKKHTRSYLIKRALTDIFTLELIITKQSFRKIFWLMMMHHHTNCRLMPFCTITNRILLYTCKHDFILALGQLHTSGLKTVQVLHVFNVSVR